MKSAGSWPTYSIFTGESTRGPWSENAKKRLSARKKPKARRKRRVAMLSVVIV